MQTTKQLVRKVAASGWLGKDWKLAARGSDWVQRNVTGNSYARRAFSAEPTAQSATYNASGPKGFKKIDATNKGRIPFANILGPMLSVCGLGVTYWAFCDPESDKYQKMVEFSNWSGTHEVTCKKVYEPETEEEVQRLVQLAQANGMKMRVVGSGISPNAMGFTEDCMISMALMDKVLEVDPENMQVRVQAGAKVQDVVEALRPHGLTLQNYASVREQQIGGFTQVSAHGTGASLPPVDEQVVSLRLVSAGLGPPCTISRDDASQKQIFDIVKVGLGSMGIVTEFTLQCVPAHRLVETTFVASRAEVNQRHNRWLRTNKHLRYMWIPYTDSVVVVQCNPTTRTTAPREWFGKTWDLDARLHDMRNLLTTNSSKSAPDIADLSATQLRDALIALNPLDVEWIKQVNAAEAEYWKKSKGSKIGWSDELLGFDCGGQQWVLEVALPTGTLDAPTGKDMDYMKDLIELIEDEQIAAPAPLEQRWSSSSAARMSPAYSENMDDVHTWVGVIMYLPTEDRQVRATITDAFKSYAELCEQRLMPKYNAKWHWAKLEAGNDAERLKWVRSYLRAQYPVELFNTVRHTVDPENNLGNGWLNSVLPLVYEPKE